MLDILRKHASSWMIKAMLGLIAIVFIFFFGSGTLRDSPQPGSEVIAEINGTPITQRKLTGRILMQRDLGDPSFKDIPEEFEQQIRLRVLQSLVESEIVTNEAYKAGFRVSSEEIAETVRQDPRLLLRGNFASQYYLKEFRPGHFNRYGIGYEEWVKNNLLADKFRDMFSKTIFVSDDEAFNYYLTNKTKINFSQITVKEENIVSILWPLFVKNRLTDKDLKKHGLNKKETGLISLPEGKTLFFGENQHEALIQLFSLSKENPFPNQPLTTGNNTYLFKFIEKVTPSKEEFKKIKEETKQELKNQLANLFYRRWYMDRIEKADIEMK